MGGVRILQSYEPFFRNVFTLVCIGHIMVCIIRTSTITHDLASGSRTSRVVTFVSNGIKMK